MSSQTVVSQTLAKRDPSFWQDVLTCFRSIHLAIVLLSLLAIGTLIGVVMPQEGMTELAAIKAQYGHNFPLLNTLGVFHVYSSFWFITLQVLFFFNLLIGSFKWLKPATLAAIQKTPLTPELLAQKPAVHSLPLLFSGRAQVQAMLKKFRYGVHTDAEGNIYASKGDITRLGPCISHLGILLCLIAGLYSCFMGFKAVRMAIPGETFTIQQANTFKTNVPSSVWLGKVPDWKIHVKDFHVDYYPDHPETAKQYYSTIQVMSPGGKLLKEDTIFVNHPLIYDNVSIYQASFAPTGRFLLWVDQKPVIVSINSQFNQRPISMIPLPDKSMLIMFPFFAGQDQGVSKNFAAFFVRQPGDKMTPGRMPENLRLAEGETGQLKGKTITFVKPEMSTGLQIKRAPEIPLMYLSYMIITLGAILCFFSQRQLWFGFKEVLPGKFEVLIYPKTNKGRLSFQKELAALSSALIQTEGHTP